MFRVVSACALGAVVLAGVGSAEAGSLKDSSPTNWSGLYVGAHAGYDWSNSGASLSAADAQGQVLLDAAALNNVALSSLSTDGGGFLGGAQIGYNIQRGLFVWGIEGDISWTGIDETEHRDQKTNVAIGPNTYAVTLSDTATSQLDWFGTLRLRGGIATSHSTLLYVTGGLAYGRVEDSWSSTVTVPSVVSGSIAAGSESGWKAGWTVGGGAEIKLTDAVSLRGEYLYYDLEDTSYSAPFGPLGVLGVAGPGSLRVESENTGSIARAAINFKLDRPERVPLK